MTARLIFILVACASLAAASIVPGPAPVALPPAPPVPLTLPSTRPTGDVRFIQLHLFIDPKGAPLAAYEVELTRDPGADVTLVGIEGGAAPAFAEPPDYDKAANMMSRIIIAAYSTLPNLPGAETRVATLSLRIQGNADPHFKVRLIVAGDNTAKAIPLATARIEGDRP